MMEAIGREDFLKELAGLGAGIHPEYPDSKILTLLPPTNHSRFWVLDPNPAAWPHFINALLTGLDEWHSGYLWPRDGRWLAAGMPPECLPERIQNFILRGAGVPDGWTGAIRFDRRDMDAVMTIMFAFLVFGWVSSDDLFLIPSHGQQLIWEDHHDVVHVECRTESRMLQFVAHLAENGYELPTELPDETFKRPRWMIENPA